MGIIRRTYRCNGYTICPSIMEDSLRWYVQTYHHTGVPWDEMNCPQFRTLALAKAWCKEKV